MKNTKKLSETHQSAKKITEKIEDIYKIAEKKNKELLITKFRGATIIVGLKNKMLKDSNFKIVEISSTYRTIYDGKKTMTFLYKNIKYSCAYLYSSNEESFMINIMEDENSSVHDENGQHELLQFFEIKELTDLKLIDLIIDNIKKLSIINK